MLQLKSFYNRTEFISFLENNFLPDDFRLVEEKLSIDDFKTQFCKDAYKLGSSKSLGLDVYEITHTSTHDARVGISKDAFQILLRKSYNNRALVLFVPEGCQQYRFSLIQIEAEINDLTSRIKRSYSNPRRYSFLLGERTHTKTPEQFLIQKGKLKPKDGDYYPDLLDRFSVEVLTKQFYQELFAWYKWTLSEEIGVTFPKNTATADDDREKLEEQIIRLITRLLFVWFVKQKHLVPNYLFDIVELKKVLKDFDPNESKNGNYYNAILQNLFFATLNKTITERAFAKEVNSRDIKSLYRYPEMFSITEDKVIEIFKPIPFLNGGLFECLDKEISTDGVKYHLDGFSRNDKVVNGHYSHRAFIPNCVFFDEQKGIIPLLERYNFTVEENAPEDVQVALDPELLGNVFENLLGEFNDETKESARKQSGSFYTPREIVDFMVSESLQAYIKQYLGEIDLNGTLTDEQKKEIYNTLLKIKILDPACGSGAFPMGILNGIISLLEKIGVAEKLNMYKLKLHLIENCIYGVDLQTIAAQISKLRFFISLIVEQGEMDINKENYGVITLPNLETKFVSANTLLGLHKKQAQGNLFEDPAIETTKQEILAVRHEHFYAKTAKDKKQLRDKDAILRTQLTKLLAENHDFAPDDAKQVVQWNPYDQNSSSPFFDTEWMFGLKDGFDIIIGNPPYVQLQKENGKLAKIYEKSGYKTFERTGDIYSLFYEKGTELLKSKGHLCFITSNKWMRAGYGASTRKFFAENTNPKLLIDFAGVKIFESATVDTNILLFSKEKNKGNTKACIFKSNGIKELSVFINQNAVNCQFLNSESWVILSAIEKQIKEKIERIGTPLKNWDIQINYGIKTGFNDAFIIDGAKRRELIEIDPKSEDIIRPLLRGRDIKRYTYEFADLYLITTFPSLKIDIELYPAVKQHLMSFGYDRLKQTGDKGARKKTNNQWFETQDSIGYWEDFSKQKIMYPDIAEKLSFSLVNEEAYSNNTVYFIVSATEDLEYLLKFLNSNLIDWYYRTLSVQLGEAAVRMFSIYVLNIPIPKNRIKNIYEAYNLTHEEISYIESISCN